MIEETSHVFLS